MRSFTDLLLPFILLFVFATDGLSQEINLDSLEEQLGQMDYPERAISVLATVKKRTVSYNKKIEILEKEIARLERTDKYYLVLAELHTSLAIAHTENQNSQLGTPHLLKAQKLCYSFGEENKDWYLISGKVHHFMAFNYYMEFKYTKAVEEEFKAYDFFKLAENQSQIGTSLNSLGVFHSVTGDPEKAISFYDQAIPILKESKNKHALLRCQFCKAVDLIILEKFFNAKKVLLEIQPRIIALNHPYKKSIPNKLGMIELKLGNYDLAETHLKSALEMAEKEKNWNSMSLACEYLVETYKKQGRYKEAITYSEMGTIYSDSLQFKAQDLKNIAAQAEYEELGRLEKIKKLELEQTIQESKFRYWISMLAGLFLLTLASIGFYFYRQNTRKKQALLLAAKEQEIQKVREKLLTAVTHELRTPLTLIIGQTEELKKRKLDKTSSEFAESAHRNAEDLLVQINQLLDWNRVEAKAMTLAPAIGDISQAVKEVYDKIKNSNFSKEMNWQIHLSDEALVGKLDFEKLKTILNNILTNALKYTPENGHINVDMQFSDRQQLQISVADNGPGIPKDHSDQIFDWYFRAQQQKQEAAPGFGVGLALSKELALLMGGDLTLDSTLGEGSTFTLNIPFKKVDQKITTPAIDRTTTVATKSALAKTNGKEEKPLLLLVEDHTELAKHISKVLSKHFEVFSTPSPFTGIEFAQDKIPDIILTDLMLPGKSGLDLCKELKSNMLTDHIPITILTAKTDLSTKFKGLENQADAYLTKPFKSEELLLTLKNLIQNRRRLRLRYQMQVQNIEERQDPFIQLIMETIKSNYSDNQFNVDAFAQKLKIGRAQLFKKTKALIGTTPSKLIRQYRLEAAKHLLESGTNTVSETAYSCGFSSPEYFSTVYKDHFKMSPKEVKAS